MADRGQKYTLLEDRKILQYIIAGDHGSAVKGDTIWKQMEEDQIVAGRAWHSLKNRWRNAIALSLDEPGYGLTEEERAMLKAQMGLSYSAKRTMDALKKTDKEHRKMLKKKQELEEGSDQSEDEVSRKESNKLSRKQSDEVSRKEKKFYSLDVQWSDGDTE